MVHPSELFRTNSDNEEANFSAPVNATQNNEIDCGITALPFLNRCFNLEKFAKPSVFVAVLSLVGFLHGTILNYFRGTSQLWGKHYNIEQESVDWLIYINDVFIAFFALVVAYWGNRIHRATWIGALTIYLAIASVTLALPEIYKPFVEKETNIDTITAAFCNHNNGKIVNILNVEMHYGALVILIIYQMIFAMASISFISHGITYLDDNISSYHSPGFIGLALAANEIGKQAGIYFSWAPYVMNIQNIFLSPVWITMSIIVLLSGTLVTLFPRTLPNIVMERAAASIVNLASGFDIQEEKIPVEGFFRSLGRILKNKILIVNILSVVLMQSSLISFSIYEKIFNATKYHVPKTDNSGYSDPFLIQFTTNLLKQPLVGISTITTGMIIAKARPRAKYLVTWNIIVFILITLFFASTKFWNCTQHGLENGHGSMLSNPYCSGHCGCVQTDGPFQPVCLDKKTYFSPCFAGCNSEDTTSNVLFYPNCTCASGGTQATKGSCDSEQCNFLLAVSQVNSIISSGLLATTLVSNIIINIRCVASKDKALALGLEATFLGLIPYLPLKAIYDYVINQFCKYDGKEKCQFYSESVTLFLSTTTIVLMCLATTLAVVVWFLVQDLDLYNKNNLENESDVELRNMSDQNDDEIDAAINDLEENSNLLHHGRLQNKHSSDDVLNRTLRLGKDLRMNNYLSEGDLVPPLHPIQKEKPTISNDSGLTTDSLREMENVGDDHDSDEEAVKSTSAPDLVDNYNKTNNVKVVETDF